MNLHHPRRVCEAVLAAGAALLCLPLPARADVIVKAEIGGAVGPSPSSASAPSASTSSAARGTPIPRSDDLREAPAEGRGAIPEATPAAAPAVTPRAGEEITIYCKGKRVRIEQAGKPTLLYDDGSELLRTLFPDQEAYREVSLKHGVPGPAAEAASGGGRGGASLQPQVAFDKVHDEAHGGEDITRSLADARATEYALTASMRASAGSRRPGRFPGGGFPGGGFPGRRRRGFPGGGFPGGGFPGGGFSGGGFPGGGGGSRGAGRGPESGGTAGTIRRGGAQVSGQFWLADGKKLPPEISVAMYPLLLESFPQGPFLKPTHDRLAKMKLFPLASQVAVTRPSATSAESSAAAGRAAVMTMTVRSIEKTTLPDDLFRLPDGYQKQTLPESF